MGLVGVLSDAHGNIEAFDAGVGLLRRLGAREFFFLGDAVGYIPSADVVRRLMEMGGTVRCVLGNHEAMLLAGNPDPERDVVYQLERTRDMLSPREIGFIESWPASIDAALGRFRTRFVHGSPAEPTYGYVYPDTDLAPFGRPADYVFLGNSHHPFVRWSDDCCFVNPGSCGLPRDDGSSGSVALFDTEAGTVVVHRYSIELANEKLLRDLPGLHPSVVAVMSRRKDTIHGTRS